MRSTLALGALLLLSACGASGAADGADLDLPEPASGPVPSLPVAPESAASPLPDIAVRRINGEGGWAQFKDELPSEQPLLVWFWAPH